MYFHVSNYRYSVGDLIQPGQWGRQVRNFKPGGPMPTAEDFHVVLWEVAMEAARLAANPDLPSRMDCIFVSETLEISTTFRDKYRAGASIFEVAPVVDCKTHRGDFALISTGTHVQAYADYMARDCLRYWTEQATNEPEILYGGSLKVLRLM